MSKYCKICGAELVEGKCPNGEHLKKMCLNCVSCEEQDGVLYCKNEEYFAAAMAKVKEAIPSGYEFEALSLKPIALKDPCKKCKKWSIDNQGVLEALIN